MNQVCAPTTRPQERPEWTWKDTLEFVRQEYLSRENYEKLSEGGTVVFNKRQLTNLLNAAFEYCQVTPLHPDTVAAYAPATPATPAAAEIAPVQSDLADTKNAAILAWWVGKRPFGWSEEEHIEEPTAYCTGAEKPLALLAVELAKAQQTVPQD
jgi:hypothetical protein